ncbi:hypothetical protein M0R45_025785 [Rubus argutus]|uniref:Uncharacterized protein n=1 Tax=Rubus argutus TaxID=59490 RepID=A0AAW1WY22_RUBAR
MYNDYIPNFMIINFASSIAGSEGKLEALQSEFQIVKKELDDDIQKAANLEKKVKVRTHVYEMRAKATHWPKIEETFKQLDTAKKELECFCVSQKQEQLAAAHRINNLWEEVQKQKELERTLQKRYGVLLVELERVQHVREKYIAQEQEQKEIKARNGDIELTDSAVDVTVVPSTDNPDPTKKGDMTVISDVNVPNNTLSAAEGENNIPLQGTSGEGSDTHLSSSDGINPKVARDVSAYATTFSAEVVDLAENAPTQV